MLQNQWTYKQILHSHLLQLLALCCPQNDVHTAVSADDVAELSNLQSKCSLFKRLLHLALREWPEVALLRMRRTIGTETRQFFELFTRITELRLISPENLSSLFLSARNVLLGEYNVTSSVSRQMHTHLLPARWPPTVFVLHQQMAGSDCPSTSTITTTQVVCTWKGLDLLLRDL
jgi:hypothetical protein